MSLDAVNLRKCKKSLEKYEKEVEGNLRKIVCVIDKLFDLIVDSENKAIKLEASQVIFHFILNGSYFSKKDKNDFLKHLFEEGCRRLGQDLFGAIH